MNLRKTLLMAMLMTLIAGSCFAITISSNEALTKDDDPRLDQKVSYDADGIPVSVALSQLSQSTGVEMNAGENKDDWMVRDRKIIVHVKDMTLRALMQEFSQILSFHWSRGGDEGKWTYRLWQDKDQRLEEQQLRTSAEDSQSKQAREKRENAIADMVNLGSLDAKDAENLKATDPWRYILATEPLGKDVAEFISSFPEARSAFVQGIGASFPVSMLSPQLQDTVRRVADSYDSLIKKINATDDYSELFSRFDKLQITINRRTLGGTDVLSQGMLGSITVGMGTDSLEIPLLDPSSPVAKALGNAVMHLRSGVSKETVGKQLQSDMTAAAKITQTATQSARDISSDPALRVNVKLFDVATKAPLPMALKSLAENSKLNIISDYFAGTPQSLTNAEKTLGEQLEIVGIAFGTNWVKAGNMLRLRDKEWFRKRTWEVPQAWMNYWIARGKQNDGLKFEDFVQIANLRDEQLDHTVIVDPNLMPLGAGDAVRNRQILRFYGLLSPDQRKSISGQQLLVSSLTDDQWAALQRALATKGAAYAAVDKGSQFLQFTQSGSDIIEYKFAYYPGENEPPVVFSLSSGVVYRTPDEIVLPKDKKTFQTSPYPN